MNESDVRLKLIDPVLKKSWDADNQIFTEYYFTDGEIIVRKNLHIRKKPKKADYLLMYRREMPIAIVEAKDSNHTVEAGLQQAMDYAIALDVPFAYSSNGKGFAEHDFTTGKVRRLGMDQFPTPDELWKRYRESKGLSTEKAEGIVSSPFLLRARRQLAPLLSAQRGQPNGRSDRQGPGQAPSRHGHRHG